MFISFVLQAKCCHIGEVLNHFCLLCDFLDGFLQNPLSGPLSLLSLEAPTGTPFCREKSWALLATSGQAEESLLSRVPSVTGTSLLGSLCASVYLGVIQSQNLKVRASGLHIRVM